jgi:NitT/TauT family transport system permease protein
MDLFKLGAKPTAQQSLWFGIIGGFFLLFIWWGAAEYFSIQKPIVEGYSTELPSSINGSTINIDSLSKADSLKFASATSFEKIYPILPPPNHVLSAFERIITKDGLFKQVSRSLWLNLKGYFWAIIIAIPLGFVLGLFPIFRSMFRRPIDALRYLPLTALTGIFIIWFGIEDQMKISFLAFGILVYLLPVVVQRIDEVEDVYKSTVFTLGANSWQTIKSVYIPSVFSKIWDDIRVLTAISWTYIIIAELLNQRGGVGALIFMKGKKGQIDAVFAILFVIIMIGFFQDKIFAWIDKRLNPFKHYKKYLDGNNEVKYGIYVLMGAMIIKILQEIFLPEMDATVMNIVYILIISALLIITFGEFKIYKSSTNA